MADLLPYIKYDKTLSGLKKFLKKYPYQEEIFYLTDTHTKKHCLPILQKLHKVPASHVITVAAGEESKGIAAWQHITQHLIGALASRNALLVNVGGGMITDLGGFAASVFKRGIKFIHVPTSLMGMIDAAIGGKTGINFTHKNDVGVFTIPERVFVSEVFLKTLPEREKISALAEALKHGLVADKKYWKYLAGCTDPNWKYIIQRSLEIKSGIVKKDPSEKKERKLLNMGHTMGHAVETFFHRRGEDILHGEAVAAGLVMEAFIAHALKLITGEEWKEIETGIFHYFIPEELPSDAAEELMAIMKHDKKNSRGAIKMALPVRIGKALPEVKVTPALIKQAIHYYQRHE